MNRFALTGPTGCGKGYVCSIIEKKYNFPCLNTDSLVHSMYENDEDLKSQIVSAFGADVCKDGKIDRRTLGNIVFADRNKLLTLNSIVHKAVREYCLEWMDKREKEGFAAVFVDAPQLFESGMDKDFDSVICVIASLGVRRQRIMFRDMISLSDAEARIANQMTNEEYLKRSDYIILNEGDDDILHQIQIIFDDYSL